MNKKKLQDELTEMFIGYQYNLDHPMPTPYLSERELIDLYRRDYIFHARVQQLVIGVMLVVSEHLEDNNN